MRWSLLLVPSTLLVVLLATGLFGAEYAATREPIFPLPFFGLDHLLAVVALGVWAGRLGGEASMVLPLAFVTGVALGLTMAMEGVGFLVLVRPMVWASVAVLSVAAALAVRPRLEEAGCLVGLFGLYHGHAVV